MSTSGIDTYSINQTQLIYAAFRVMGVYNDDSPPPQNDINNASQALNLMIKSWVADGYPLWCVVPITIPLVPGTVQYTLGPTGMVQPLRPLRVTYGRLHYISTGLEVPLIQLSRQEYEMLGNKTNTGTPNSYYYDPQLGNGVLSLYLPADASNSLGNTVILTVQRTFQDMNSPINDFDFPVEWLNALKFGLAAELCMEYDVPIQKSQGIIQKASMTLDKMMNWSVEEASTFFTPNMQYISSSRR